MCGSCGGAVTAEARHFLARLFTGGADLRRVVAGILEGIGALVFNDRLHTMLWRREESWRPDSGLVCQATSSSSASHIHECWHLLEQPDVRVGWCTQRV